MAKAVGCGVLIVLAGIVAYSDSFEGPFVFDDLASIAGNATIRDLSRLGEVLSPPADGRTVGGRPVPNLTFALDYAGRGLDVEGFHLTNLAVHLLCALVLFGVVRRTLLLPGIPAPLAQRADGVGLMAALAWSLHPLCTAAVTYLVQRCESLMALWYFLALYCLIRAAGPGRPVGWAIGAVASCALGMASKEVMATAPLVLLLYDRAFLTGSFRAALRGRPRLYAGMAATWGLLAWLMVRSGSRATTIGFGGDVAWQDYAKTQAVAVLTYLRLAAWPNPLVFDYGAEPITDPARVVPCAAVLALLLAGSVLLLLRRPRIGFLAAAFFLVLAPSSSVVPVVTQSMGEHRAYLPLAAIVVLAVLGGALACARLPLPARLALPAAAVAALGSLTFLRNRDYRDELVLWQDTVAKLPDSPRAHNNLATTLVAHRRPEDALPHYREAVRLKPRFVEAQNGLGSCLTLLRRSAEAEGPLREALRLRPDHAGARLNLGNALEDLGRLPEAEAEYREAIRCRPDYAKAHLNLGAFLAKSGRRDEAIGHFEEALRIQPDYGAAHHNLAVALSAAGRLDEAARHFEEAARLKERDRRR